MPSSSSLAAFGADLCLVRGFELRLVGSGGGDARGGVVAEAVARVEHDAICGELANQGGSGCAEAVVGNEDRVGLFREAAGFVFDGCLQAGG